MIVNILKLLMFMLKQAMHLQYVKKIQSHQLPTVSDGVLQEHAIFLESVLVISFLHECFFSLLFRGLGKGDVMYFCMLLGRHQSSLIKHKVQMTRLI